MSVQRQGRPSVGDFVRTKPGVLAGVGVVAGKVMDVWSDGTLKIAHMATEVGLSFLMPEDIEVIPVVK